MEPQNQQPVQQPIQQSEGSTANYLPPQQSGVGSFLKNRLFLLAGVLILTILVIGVLLAISSQGGNKDTSLKKAQEAEQAYNNGDLPTTQEKLLESYKLTPKDPAIQAALIKSIAVEGNLTGTEQEAFTKAEPYIKEALESNGNNADVLLAVGYVHEIAGKYEEALGFYEKALQVDENNAEGWFHKGHVLEFLGRQSEAFASYEKAYQLDQTNPQINLVYAKTLLAKGDRDGATKIYLDTSMMADTPPYLRAEVLTNAAILAKSDIQNPAKALEYAKQAVDAYPQYAPARAEYGFMLGLNGKFDDGIANMKASIEANPRISQTYWRLGALYRLAGDYQQAVVYQQQAFERVDNDNTILGEDNKKIIKAAIAYDLATSNVKAGSYENVISLLSTAINLNPNLRQQLETDLSGNVVFRPMNQDSAIRALLQ